MRTRLAFLCAVSGTILWAQISSPIRSAAEATRLEAELKSHPDDLESHARLLNYYYPQATRSAAASRLHRQHALWLIEHHPENSALRYAGAIDPQDDPEGFAQCSAAWQKALSAKKPLFDAYANAASFYRKADPRRARGIADAGLKRYPGNRSISGVKGRLMADAIAGQGAQRDRAALEGSDDVYGLREAAMELERSAGSRKDLEDLVIRLYQRGEEVDPNGSWDFSLANAYRDFASRTKAPDEKLALLEKAMAAAKTTAARVNVLPDLAQQYLAMGDTAKAAEAANEVLALEQDPSDWNYGNANFAGNTVLGRVALIRGDAKEAARRLLAAAKTTSPQLGSFGPTDWRLPEDLLAAGDRDSVLAYLEALHQIWKNDRGRLDAWAADIRAGRTPRFASFGVAEFPKSRYVGRPAPQFRLKDLKGAEVSLADFKGKVVLIDFWATWCGPCRMEMPEFQNIHADPARKDVAVLALDADEPLETVAAYISKEKFTFPVLLSSGSDVLKDYGVQAFPTTFAIDKDGMVADVKLGSGSDLRALIERARAGAPKPVPEPTMAAITSNRGMLPPSPATTADDFYCDATRQHNGRDYAAAIQSLNRALELRPDWLPAVVARADNQYHAKQYEEAIAGFSLAIELDPRRAASYDSRGLAYSYGGKHDRAIADYTRAIEINPSSTFYNNRGWAYLELGKLDEALADLNRALELNPAYTMALFNRAHLFEKRKEYGKAIADYDSILHVEPSNSVAVREKTADQRLDESDGRQ